jgi:hypothetical protein
VEFTGDATGLWPRWLLALSWPIPSLVIIALGIAAALRGCANDLVEARRRIPLALALIVGAMIAVVVAAELNTSGWPPQGTGRLINAAALLIPPARPAPVAPEADDSRLLARLGVPEYRLRRAINQGLFATTTHHDLHHNGSFNHNYGLYFTWRDRIMGTEHPGGHCQPRPFDIICSGQEGVGHGGHGKQDDRNPG